MGEGPRWALLAVLTLLAGPVQAASEAGPAPVIQSPPPELARIYFYRQAQPLMVLLSPDVIVNGKSVGDLSVGEMFYRDARPGRYQVFLSGTPEHTVELTLAAGQVGFVRCTLRIGLGTTRLQAESVDPEEATREIVSLGNEGDGPKQPENLP